ncbi:MAG: extracellular solute-binding protein [Peptostreptococcaceae bacterium]|nr:extracellular solute-binding protein [Peptostreptococcaceae bacterium]
MKRLMTILAVGAISLGLMAGCAKKEETGTNQPTTPEKNQTEMTGLEAYTPENPITITFWNFPNFTGDSEFDSKGYDAALIKAFEEKHPNVKVEYQAIEFSDGPAKLETAIQSQTNPDVVYDAPGRVIDWASKGYLVDLEDIVPKSELIPAAVTASSFDGKIYLYPQGVAPFMMGFNKGMLEELGIADMLPLDKEHRAWTVEEFQALLEAIKEKKPEVAPVILYAKSQAGDQGPRAFVSNLYGSWITDDAVTKYTINDENGVKSMEWIKMAYDKGLLGKGIALDAGAAIEEFGNQTAAGTILYPVNKYKEFTKDGKMDSVLIPFPNNSGKTELEYLVAGPAIFDNNDEDRIAASKLFVDFMINDEQWGQRTLKATGNFSAKTGVTGLYDDEELKFAETMSEFYGPYYNTIPGFIQMRQLWFPMVQGVLNGDVQPKPALDEFVEAANKTIEDAK